MRFIYSETRKIKNADRTKTLHNKRQVHSSPSANKNIAAYFCVEKRLKICVNIMVGAHTHSSNEKHLHSTVSTKAGQEPGLYVF
jgi:hypothetical protein